MKVFRQDLGRIMNAPARTRWENIQPITVRHASNGISLFSSGRYIWSCDTPDLLRAIEAAKAQPAGGGDDSAQSDYTAFCNSLPVAACNGNVKDERVRAALIEFELVGLL